MRSYHGMGIAISKMKNGKAAGPPALVSEIVKSAREAGS